MCWALAATQPLLDRSACGNCWQRARSAAPAARCTGKWGRQGWKKGPVYPRGAPQHAGLHPCSCFFLVSNLPPCRLVPTLGPCGEVISLTLQWGRHWPGAEAAVRDIMLQVAGPGVGAGGAGPQPRGLLLLGPALRQPIAAGTTQPHPLPAPHMGDLVRGACRLLADQQGHRLVLLDVGGHVGGGCLARVLCAVRPHRYQLASFTDLGTVCL